MVIVPSKRAANDLGWYCCRAVLSRRVVPPISFNTLLKGKKKKKIKLDARSKWERSKRERKGRAMPEALLLPCLYLSLPFFLIGLFIWTEIIHFVFFLFVLKFTSESEVELLFQW